MSDPLIEDIARKVSEEYGDYKYWFSLLSTIRWKGAPWSTLTSVGYWREGNRLAESLIQDAPLEVCLVSPSEYVREYRKWWEAQNKEKRDSLLREG